MTIRTIEAVMRTKTKAHWLAEMEAAGIPCGPVLNYDQVFTDRMTVVKVSLNITGLVQKGPWVPGAKLDVKGTVRLTEADKDGTPKT